jgi:hypothetical protein
LFAWNFFRGFDWGFHRNIWNHLDFVCLTFLLLSNSKVEQKYMQSMWIRSNISQKHLESLRFCLLDISSVEQFKGRTEIYGIMEIFFSRSFFCWSDRAFGRNIVWRQMRFRFLEISSVDEFEALTENLYAHKVNCSLNADTATFVCCEGCWSSHCSSISKFVTSLAS